MMRSKLHLAFVIALFLSSAAVNCAGSPRIVYDGTVTGSSEGVVLDGVHQADFRIYSSLTAATPVWRELQPKMDVVDGRFKVVLGTIEPLSLDWQKPYFIAIAFDGEAEGTHREPLYRSDISSANIPQGSRTGLAYIVADGPLYEPQVSVTPTAVPGGNWGANIGSFEGVIAYSNGADTGSWSSLEPVGQDGYQYQCVEYTRRFYRVHMGMNTSGWNGNGNQWYGYGPGRGLQQIPNNGSSLPQPEDILCFNYAPYGHVAIVTSADSGRVNVIQENVSSSTAFGYKSISGGIVQGSCQGWLRKPNPCTSPTNLRWTNLNGLQSGRWYRTGGETRLEYAVDGGTNPVYCQEFAGSHNATYETRSGYIGLAWGGLGMKDFRVESWSGCNNQRIGINYTFTVGWDDQAPTASRSGGASTGTWYKTPQTVSWSASDGNSGVRRQWYRWNGGGWTESGGPAPLHASTLQQGPNTLEVQVEDNADNAGTTSGNLAIINLGQYLWDTVGPTPTLTGPAASHWFNQADGPQTVSWSATDATSNVATKSLTWDTGTSTGVSPAQIPEGRRTATVTATDNAGNTSSQSFGPFWVDTIAPVLSLATNPAEPNGENGWYTVEPVMTVAAIDPNGADGSGIDQVFYSIDGSEHPYANGVTISGDGIHPCAGRATDVAGNSGSSNVEVKVDTTAPVFGSITTFSTSGSLSILSASWECDDPTSAVAEYEYSIYHEAGDSDELVLGPAVTDQPWAYETNLGLTSGQAYFFRVRAKNNAGLWSDTFDSDPILALEGTGDVSPSFNAGGVSVPEQARTSTNYMLVDSMGQFVVNTSSSPNFVVEHGYWHSDVVTPWVESIYAAKCMDDDTVIALGSDEKPVVVTVEPGVFADRFYVEQRDRSSGIAVRLLPGTVTSLLPGDRVRINGTVGTLDGERVIGNATATLISHGDPLGALFVSNLWLGGRDLNEWTPGVSGVVGLHNIGLLIKTSGKIGQVDPGGAYFYIDDGSNLQDGTMTDEVANVGVRILGDGRGYTPDTFLSVTGVSSCFTDGGPIKRMIRPVTIQGL